MKYTLTLLLFLSLSISVHAQNHTRVISMVTYMDGGNQMYRRVFGATNREVNQEIVSLTHGHTISFPINGKKYVLDTRLMDYLAVYVNNHCISKSSRNSKTGIMPYSIIIDIRGDYSVQACYIVGKNWAKAYWAGLIAWLKKYPDQSKVTGIIDNITPSLRYLSTSN